MHCIIPLQDRPDEKWPAALEKPWDERLMARKKKNSWCRAFCGVCRWWQRKEKYLHRDAKNAVTWCVCVCAVCDGVERWGGGNSRYLEWIPSPFWPPAVCLKRVTRLWPVLLCTLCCISWLYTGFGTLSSVSSVFCTVRHLTFQPPFLLHFNVMAELMRLFGEQNRVVFQIRSVFSFVYFVWNRNFPTSAIDQITGSSLLYWSLWSSQCLAFNSINSFDWNAIIDLVTWSNTSRSIVRAYNQKWL